MRNLPEAFINFSQLPDEAYIDQRTYELLENISSATLWRYIAKGLIPKPERIGPRMNRWRAGIVRAARAARKAEGNNHAA